jgi:argininosuccinate synthase
LDIAFERGIPTALDGEELDGRELISRVNQLAGQHGVGVLDHIEDRLVGIKSREVYECPAAVTLIAAHTVLEKLVLTRHQLGFKRGAEQEWAWLVYSGLWVDPLRDDLDRFIDSTQQRVTGRVRVKLFKGHLRVVGRSSPNSLYNVDLATYDASSTFDQKAAVGFIDLWGLPTRVAYAARKPARSGREVKVVVRGHPSRQETQRSRT